jgi:Nuclease-related domain/AAA domain/UvrD-like helicase C-terminal domain
MIPAQPRAGANKSELAVFSALEAITDRPDWVVIHSLTLTDNLFTLHGEADFVVIVPGRGIVVIEAKSPNYAVYEGGEWYLDKTPKPDKSPLDQLNKATSAIHRFLANRDAFNDIPIARLLWFTSLGRFQFENKTPGDMQFFEWEMALSDDLEKPARAIEHVLDEYFKANVNRRDVSLNKSDFDVAAAQTVSQKLINDFKIYQTPDDRYIERTNTVRRVLAEQVALLDVVETNEHIYLDGAAGTGKSFLLLEAARNAARKGRKCLVTCWNVMMAEELRRELGPRANIDVYDLNTLMLEVCGLQSNPKNADTAWYQATLPARALEVLEKKPHWGDYESVFVDEFQDIAHNTTLLALLFDISASKKAKGTQLVLAGDKNQQIMRENGQAINPFDVAKMIVPDMVHVRLRTNCRTAPALADKVPGLTGLNVNIIRHRLPSSTDGGFGLIRAADDKATKALASTLRGLLETYRAKDIRVLSPFGAKNSLIGDLFNRESKTADERWLKTVLRDPNGTTGEIRWRSIAKFKGLESDVVVVTDINSRAQEFATETGKSLSELLYVGVTRARFRCIVIASQEVLKGLH